MKRKVDIWDWISFTALTIMAGTIIIAFLYIGSKDITVSEYDKGSVIYDDEDIRMKFISIETDSDLGPVLNITITNNSSDEIMLDYTESDVNGYYAHPFSMCKVEPGCTENASILFILDDIAERERTYAGLIKISVRTIESDTYKKHSNYKSITIESDKLYYCKPHNILKQKEE